MVGIHVRRVKALPAVVRMELCMWRVGLVNAGIAMPAGPRQGSSCNVRLDSSTDMLVCRLTMGELRKCFTRMSMNVLAVVGTAFASVALGGAGMPRLGATRGLVIGGRCGVDAIGPDLQLSGC